MLTIRWNNVEIGHSCIWKGGACLSDTCVQLRTTEDLAMTKVEPMRTVVLAMGLELLEDRHISWASIWHETCCGAC